MSRNRTSRVHLRLLPSEKENLLNKANSARMSMTDYVVALSEGKQIYVIDDVPKLVVEITRIGTNINQIAAVVNAHKTASDYQLQEVQKDLKEIQNQLSMLLKKIYAIDEEETEI